MKSISVFFNATQVDSVHAAIDRAAKRERTVLLASHWRTLIRNARPDQPFHVHEMKREQFLDFRASPSYTSRFGSTKMFQEGVFYQYNKDDTNAISLRRTFSATEDWTTYRTAIALAGYKPGKQYNNERNLWIKTKKKQDLIGWVSDGVIPLKYLDKILAIPSFLDDSTAGRKTRDTMVANAKQKWKMLSDDTHECELQNEDEDKECDQCR